MCFRGRLRVLEQDLVRGFITAFEWESLQCVGKSHCVVRTRPMRLWPQAFSYIREGLYIVLLTLSSVHSCLRCQQPNMTDQLWYVWVSIKTSSSTPGWLISARSPAAPFWTRVQDVLSRLAGPLLSDAFSDWHRNDARGVDGNQSTTRLT